MKSLFLLLLTSAVALAQDAGIRNFLRVNETFCTGAQPTLEHLEKLKAEGVRAVINLRVPSEHDAPAEEAKAMSLGLRYINIPVVSSNPQDAQAEEFLKVTDDAQNRPAFIHCASANRVGAFWMIRRVLRDKWSVQDAEAEALKIGMAKNGAVHTFALKYIDKNK
ncbi:MAG: protein tyrosine phosphatase family protein [Acidobacteria bacterium]|nr:protein tyrosine phosphatase family protein [Acidobacteriota bacterium]